MLSRNLSGIWDLGFGLLGFTALFWNLAPQECRAVVVLDQAHVLPPFVGSVGSAVTNNNLLAQTFTVGQSGLLTQVDLAVDVFDFAAGDLVFAIQPTNGGVPSPNTSSALFTTPITLDSINDFSLDDIFTTSVDVSSASLFVQTGEVLAWTLQRPTTSDSTVFVNSGGDDYTGGESFRRSSTFSNWNLSSSTIDRFFRTFVDTDATSGSKSLDPSVAARVELENGTFELDTSPFMLTTFQNLSSGIDDRVILEFPISAIPPNVILTEATLDLKVTLRSNTAELFPVVPIFGYDGDGFAEVNDANVTAHLLGATQPITASELITIDLDTAYIQSLLGNSTHLGLVLMGDENRLQVGFDNFSTKPVLHLSFDFLTPGDFDQDQDVDGSDFLQWQRGESPNAQSSADLADWSDNFGASNAASAATTVPEPSAGILLASLAMIVGLQARNRSVGRPSLAVSP